MSEVYKLFSQSWPELDYSDEARLELFLSETYGESCSATNGFAASNTSASPLRCGKRTS